jgi:hypothetical protein
VPLTAVTVPAIGALSTVPATAASASPTASCAWVTWFSALEVSEPASCARVSASRAASRSAWAAPSVRFAAAGSTLASVWPFLTSWPTRTSIAVTMPPVTKPASAVLALSTEPSAVTVAVTAPCCTVTVRAAAFAAGGVPAPEIVWYAHQPPPTSAMPSRALTATDGRRTERRAGMADTVAGRARRTFGVTSEPARRSPAGAKERVRRVLRVPAEERRHPHPAVPRAAGAPLRRAARLPVRHAAPVRQRRRPGRGLPERWVRTPAGDGRRHLAEGAAGVCVAAAERPARFSRRYRQRRRCGVPELPARSRRDPGPGPPQHGRPGDGEGAGDLQGAAADRDGHTHVLIRAGLWADPRLSPGPVRGGLRAGRLCSAYLSEPPHVTRENAIRRSEPQRSRGPSPGRRQVRAAAVARSDPGPSPGLIRGRRPVRTAAVARSNPRRSPGLIAAVARSDPRRSPGLIRSGRLV